MDWRKWHEEYDDPSSRLSGRLDVVRARLTEVLNSFGSGEVRILSLCGGDARDVVPVLSAHPSGRRARTVVVELDEVLAQRARDAVRQAGLDWVDVLLLCGIFGNIERDDVRRIVGCIPSMVTEGGFVIWTRGGHDGADDPRSEVRRWFVESGLPEVAFDGPPNLYGVGVNRVVNSVDTSLGTTRLFTFNT